MGSTAQRANAALFFAVFLTPAATYVSSYRGVGGRFGCATETPTAKEPPLAVEAAAPAPGG